MTNQFTHPWTKEEVIFLKENIKKLKYEEMGVLLNRTYSSIQSKIRHLPFQKKIQKYSININFFKELTPSVAYVLGFIAADGNICHSGGAHVLHIASDDQDVVEKIKPLMKYEGPIHKKVRMNGKISYSLRICDQTIFNDLKKLNVTERKSLTIKPPTLKKELVSHYIRGYFDGDGSVFSYHHPKYPSQNLSVHFYTASQKMAKYIITVIKRLPDIHYQGQIREYLAHQKTKYYIISLGSGPSKKLFEYMYKNSNGLYMDRKYNKFVQGIKYAI